METRIQDEPGEQRSKWPITTNLGVIQECPLSPILFNAYVDINMTWKNELRTNNMTMVTLLFADDQAVMTKHENNLQRALYMLNR